MLFLFPSFSGIRNLYQICCSQSSIKNIFNLNQVLLALDKNRHYVGAYNVHKKNKRYNMFDWNFSTWFYLFFLLYAIPAAIMIIWEKRSPYKTAAWVLTLILIPILGVIFYLFFGQEYRKRKLFSRRGLKGMKNLRRLALEQIKKIESKEQITVANLENEAHIIRLLLNNSNALFTTGNELTILSDGKETFEAMFKVIAQAHHHIHLEYYIFEEGEIGTRLKNLLIKKCSEGVEVRIIVDDVGSWGLRKKTINELKTNGIQFFSFMEVRFPRLTSRVNYRNHRKILIVDGRQGFIGGVNIADRYINGLKGRHWRDTHLHIKGDAASGLQIIFTVDWYFLSQQNLFDIKHFPPLTEGSGTPVQIAASGPDYDWESIAQAYLAIISNAREKLFIVTPYLMPPPPLLLALKTAALSGVDVRIIIPEKSDAVLSKWCSFSYVEELLEAGIRIFFFQNGFIHSKYLLADNIIASVGTSNFDFRSFETNFEANAFIYQREFSEKLEKRFMEDQRQSREIVFREWQKRPWLKKLEESLAHIISPMF